MENQRRRTDVNNQSGKRGFERNPILLFDARIVRICGEYGKTVAILNKVERYNAAIKAAPARLYILYISLYVKNNTQAALADDWGYTREYIKEINQKLVEYLQKTLA